MPATRKLLLEEEQGTALVIIEVAEPVFLKRTRIEWPAVHGPALNKATSG